MKKLGHLLFAVLLAGATLIGQPSFAASPRLKMMAAQWDFYGPLLPGSSNAVFTLWKSTWLGTVASPWKPTAFILWPRTNVNFAVLPGSYRFKLTITTPPFGESLPSNILTNTVSE